MSRKRTHEEFLEEIKLKNPHFNDIEIISEYKTCKDKITYICKKCMKTLECVPNALLNQQRGCLYCDGYTNRLDLEFVIEKFLQYGLILLDKNYKNNDTKLKCCCKEHNDVILYKRYRDLRDLNNSGCYKCNSKYSTYCLENAIDIFKSFGYELLATEYVSVDTPMPFLCFKHNDEIQYKTLESLTRGQICRKCKIEETTKKLTLDYNFVKEQFESRGYELLEKEYINRKIKMQYRCKIHPDEILYTTYNLFSQGKGCPFCANNKGEKLISEFLTKNKIDFMPQKTFDDCRSDITNSLLRFDFYIPSLNLCIEYQGGQHEKPIEYFGGEKRYKIQVRYDNIKKEYCKNNNIELFEIWYYDYKNVEKILYEKLKPLKMEEL